MAASTMNMSLVMGKTPSAIKSQHKVSRRASRVQTKALWGSGYIGSDTNVIMCNAIAAVMVASRIGAAPSEMRPAGPVAGKGALTLADPPEEKPIGKGYDPAGFTAVDVLATASLGHVIGIGLVLGLKATGLIE